MAIKESSDELNPTVVIADPVVALPRPRRSVRDYLALAIATCGVGYLPLAPGTWGSLVGVGGYLSFELFCFRVLPFRPPAEIYIGTIESIEASLAYNARMVALRATILALVVTLLTWVGIWAATRTEKLSGRKDPGKVVIDEVAGQLLTFVLIPNPAKPWMLVVGFLLFRAFDILKPYPARRMESLESGLGIMADDVVAGAYAAVGTSIIIAVALIFIG